MIETSLVQTSFSTVIMAVFTTNAFLILLALCLVNEKLLVRAGYKLLALFVLFTTLRFVLPIELPFTITLKFPALISQVIASCHNRLFQFGEQPISLWLLFKLIWLIGFIIGLISHCFAYYSSSRHIVLYGKELTHSNPYKKLLAQICEEKGCPNVFRVIELPGLDVPALFGIIHPRILVPENFELPERQLLYILRHETAHHFKHDILLKNIIKIITFAYWWDIFSWLLNRQTDVIMEMRIDDSLTMTNATVTQEYMQCLIEMSDRASQKRILPNSLTIGILPSGYKDLKRRFRLMMNNRNKPQTKWSILLLVIALSIYLFSYTIILEAYTPPEEIAPTHWTDIDDINPSDYIFISDKNSYFIDNEDGSYEFYIDDSRIETVTSLDYYPKDIPIYTKDTAPQCNN